MMHTALKLVGRSIAQVVDFLALSCEQSLADTPQMDGSRLLGDYNFRTSRMDCGTDAYGWYSGADGFAKHQHGASCPARCTQAVAFAS